MTSCRTLVATLAALPIVLAATGLVVLEAARWSRPKLHLFTPPAAASLADALAGGDLVRAHELLTREPGALLWVSHPELTGGQSTLVSPLLWAVGTGDDDAVRMLLGMGHDMSSGPNRHAVCLARALGKTNTAELLLAFGKPSNAPCPVLPSGVPPLLALVQGNR